MFERQVAHFEALCEKMVIIIEEGGKFIHQIIAYAKGCTQALDNSTASYNMFEKEERG